MSIKQDGLLIKSKSINVSIFVDKNDKLITLSNHLDWESIFNIVLPNLKKTAKGFWWLGRSLFVRTHLGVMVLQSLLKATDRQMEDLLRSTPKYQVFCGLGVVSNWKCPDHTKIEEFRNRISPETHKKIGDHVVLTAQKLGFADPSWVDIDSTVQESPMSYPTDAGLMKKMSLKCYKVIEYLKEKGFLTKTFQSINIKKITKLSKDYFFLAKNAAMEKRRTLFSELHKTVKTELKESIQYIESLSEEIQSQFDWNIKEHISHINKGWRYLLDVAHFIRTGTLKEGKLLCFYLNFVACIKKGKVGKEKEFGRVFQLGRIGGNFVIPFTCTDVKMNDKTSFPDLLKEFEDIFGKDVLKSVATDKGYFSKENKKELLKRSIPTVGMQKPGDKTDDHMDLQKEELKNRRAGIEPLIGHIKKFGLGRSRMKKDHTILASGYRSIMGFNLNQLMRLL